MTKRKDHHKHVGRFHYAGITHDFYMNPTDSDDSIIEITGSGQMTRKEHKALMAAINECADEVAGTKQPASDERVIELMTAALKKHGVDREAVH
jgi:hypothetical protein